MYTSIQEAILQARQSGIIVEFDFAEDENHFHRARAAYADKAKHFDERVCLCLKKDPLKAIEGAVDALLKKPENMLLQ